MPVEACLVSGIEFINSAHDDPEVRGMRLSSMRGGDKETRADASQWRQQLRVSVIGPAAEPASYVAEVAWGAVRLQAKILLVAYLDDIYCSSEALLVRPYRPGYRRTLGAKGRSLVGLRFTNVAKNSTFVPRCFAAEARALFPDASFVNDTTPGATPMDQHRLCASRQPRGSGE